VKLIQDDNLENIFVMLNSCPAAAGRLSPAVKYFKRSEQ